MLETIHLHCNLHCNFKARNIDTQSREMLEEIEKGKVEVLKEEERPLKEMGNIKAILS